MDITALKAQLGDELYAQAAEKLKDVEGMSIIQTNDGSWLPKARLDDEIGKHKATKAALADLTKQLEEAKKAGDGSEALKEAVEALKAQLAERDSTISGMKRSQKVRAALAKANAKDPAVIERLLDQAQIGEDEKGELTGVEEQLKALRESAGYLFNEEPKPKGGWGGAKTQPQGSGDPNADVNAAIRAAAGRG